MSTTTRDEILAGEQRAVDHAYDCCTAKLAELSGTSAPGRSPRPENPSEVVLRRQLRCVQRIVETIRRDQMELVTGSPSYILVVQGGPGTGKAEVGLHRVTWLANNEHFKAQDILVIGPHQRFLDYVGQVLPTLGTRDVNVVQLDRLREGRLSAPTRRRRVS